MKHIPVFELTNVVVITPNYQEFQTVCTQTNLLLIQCSHTGPGVLNIIS